MTNPLMDLRRLDEEKRRKHISSNDEINEEMKKSTKEATSEDTQTSTKLPARRPIKKPARITSFKDADKDVSVDANVGTRGPARKPRQKEGNEALPASSYTAMKARVLGPASKEAITRLNLDMPEALHDRMKLYCAARKIKIRTLVCALVEDFLAHEGASEE